MTKGDATATTNGAIKVMTSMVMTTVVASARLHAPVPGLAVMTDSSSAAPQHAVWLDSSELMLRMTGLWFSLHLDREETRTLRGGA